MLNNNDEFSVCKMEADAFLQVAKQCAENVDKLLSGLMYPFAVNVSFSCELYLKAIMMQSNNGEFERGHNLQLLFAHLKTAEQDAIVSYYNQKHNKNLSVLLAESPRAFEEWRYAMESKVSINVDGMIDFAESLKQYLESSNKAS